MPDSPFDRGFIPTLANLLTRLRSAPTAYTRQTRTPIHPSYPSSADTSIAGWHMTPGATGQYISSKLTPRIMVNEAELPQSNYTDPLAHAQRYSQVVGHEQYHAAQDSYPDLQAAAASAKASNPAYQRLHDMFTSGLVNYPPKEADIELPAFLASDTLLPMNFGDTIRRHTNEEPAPLIDQAKQALTNFLLPSRRKLVRR